MRPRPPLLGAPPGAPRAAFARPLPTRFYDRPTTEVAIDLLGRLLIRRTRGRFSVARIVETEAYPAGDRANHANLGPTVRNRMMFGPPGTLYVYRIHQVHCMNAVTGQGEAVLIRSAEPGPGVSGDPRGPGRLCRVFGIGPEENGLNLVDGPIRIAGRARPRPPVVRGPRVGISRDVNRPYRFAIRGNRWVSSPRLDRRERAPAYRSFAQS